MAGSPSPPKSLGVGTRPRPKWILPEPVDQHAGRHRIAPIRQPVGQSPPLAWPRGEGGVGLAEHHWNARFDLRAGQSGVAAQQDVSLGMTVFTDAHDLDAGFGADSPRVASVLIGDITEERQEPVVVALGERIFLVVVAAGAVDRQAQENLASRRDDAVQAVETGQLAVGGLVVPETQPVKPGGDQRLGRGRVDLVAGELLLEKPIVGLVPY